MYVKKSRHIVLVVLMAVIDCDWVDIERAMRTVEYRNRRDSMTSPDCLDAWQTHVIAPSSIRTDSGIKYRSGVFGHASCALFVRYLLPISHATVAHIRIPYISYMNKTVSSLLLIESVLRQLKFNLSFNPSLHTSKEVAFVIRIAVNGSDRLFFHESVVKGCQSLRGSARGFVGRTELNTIPYFIPSSC